MLILMVFSYHFAFWHQIYVIDLYYEKFIEINLLERNSNFFFKLYSRYDTITGLRPISRTGIF